MTDFEAADKAFREAWSKYIEGSTKKSNKTDFRGGWNAGWQACEAQMADRDDLWEAVAALKFDFMDGEDNPCPACGQFESHNAMCRIAALRDKVQDRVRAAVEQERKRVLEQAEKAFKDVYSDYEDPLIGVMYALKAIRALAAASDEEGTP